MIKMPKGIYKKPRCNKCGLIINKNKELGKQCSIKCEELYFKKKNGLKKTL